MIGRVLPTLPATRGLLGSGAPEVGAYFSRARYFTTTLGGTAEYTMNVSVRVIAMDGYMQRPQLLPACVSGVALVASIIVCLIMYACRWWIRARRRRRENELVVEIAETSTEIDEWENEIENQHVRRAAETDEEEEEEAVKR